MVDNRISNKGSTSDQNGECRTCRADEDVVFRRRGCGYVEVREISMRLCLFHQDVVVDLTALIYFKRFPGEHLY